MKKKLRCVLSMFILCMAVILPVAGQPEVLSTSPADAAVKVAIDISQITVTFDQPIVVDTGTSVTVKDQSWKEQPLGMISVNGDTLVINAPASPWLQNWKTYYVQVSGVRDTGGDVMTAYDFHFQTVSTDTTAPTVISTSPEDGATVPLETTISALMSEDINRCVGTITMADQDGVPVELTWDAEDYRTIVIDTDLPLSTGTYTVTMTGLIDSFLNELDQPYSWSFTLSEDHDSPTVTATDPAGGATGVPACSMIVVTMNENVNACIGTVTITDSNGNVVPSDWDIIPPDYRHLYIDPAGPLALGVTYTVTLEDFVDFSGNVMAPYSWSFTVKTPDENIQFMGATVDNLGLPADIERGLLAKLKTARSQMLQRKNTPARNALCAFINQVNEERGDTLSPVQADAFISDARSVIIAIPGK